MDQTETVEAEPGHVYVVHEVLPLEREFVVLFVVAADCEHLTAATLDCDHVRPRDAVFVVNSVDQQISVNLVDGVPLVICKGVPTFFGFLLLDVRVVGLRLPEVDVPVEPCGLQLLQLVLRLAHHVGYTLCSLDIRRPVGHNYVFCGDINGYLTPQIGVKIHLFEGRTGQTEAI